MKKRILSAILTIGMLFSYATAGYVSAEENSVAGFQEKFSAIGISIDSMFNGEYITRGKFAELIVEFIDATAEETTEYTSFVDVSTSHPSASAINLLYERRYISGVESYIFEPDRNITYSESLSVILNILGYKMNTDFYGGYLAGILRVADEVGLLEGVAIDVSVTATKDNLYRILDNALEANMMIAKLKGDGYEVSKSETLAMEFYHDVLVTEGIVESNQYTSLSASNSIVDENKIRINDIEYISEEEMQKYLGYNVKCYYKVDDDTFISLYIEPTKKNKTLDINGDEVTGINDEYMQYEDENGRIRKASLNNVKIIYNGTAYTGYGHISSINFNDTYVKLLSSDNDDKYDIMFITQYSDYYVSDIDFKNQVVYDRKNNTNICLDPDEFSVLIYGEDGNVLTLEEIKRDTVLSVAVSPNTSGVILKTAYVVNDIVEGKISRIDEERGYQIGDNYYKKSNNCILDIKLGQTVKVILGKSGKIVTRVLVESEQIFGIYNKLYIDEENDERIILKIFTQDGEFAKIPVEKKVKIDNINVNVTESALNANLSQGDAILFELVGEKIKKIKKAKTKSTGELEDFKLMLSGDSLSVRGNLLGGVVLGDIKSTIVMNLPTDLSKTDEWSIYKTGTDFESLRYAQFEIYNFGETIIPTADAMIVYDMAAAEIDDQTSSLFVVKSIIETLDEDDMPVTQLNLINQENVEQAYYLKDTLDTTVTSGYQNVGITKIKGVVLSNIDSGDIVRVATAGDGRVSKIEKILDVTDRNDEKSRLKPLAGLVDTTHYYNTGKYIDMGRIIYGTIGGYENNTIKFTTSFYPTIPDWQNNTNVGYREELAMLKTENRVIVYDKDAEISRTITRDEINNYIGKECVLRCYQLNTGEVIIYE